MLVNGKLEGLLEDLLDAISGSNLMTQSRDRTLSVIECAKFYSLLDDLF